MENKNKRLFLISTTGVLFTRIQTKTIIKETKEMCNPGQQIKFPILTPGLTSEILEV